MQVKNHRIIQENNQPTAGDHFDLMQRIAVHPTETVDYRANIVAGSYAGIEKISLSRSQGLNAWFYISVMIATAIS